MVSFQCHACGDVVKKPKLDQHHGRCHAGFDCIDCSGTFNNPAEFKSHTSCITEAEKYQKSLYKGKKGGENGNDHTYGYNASRGGRGGRGRGNYGGRGGYQGRPRSEGTGANSTPLGTPQRMSPVAAPANDAPENRATIANVVVAPESSLDVMPISSPAKIEGSDPLPERPKKEKKNKDKKPKSKSHGEAKVDENSVVDPAIATAADKAIGPTEKKKKKRLDGEPGTRGDQKVGESNITERAPIPEPQSSYQTNDTTMEKKKKKKRADVEQTATSERSKMDLDEQDEGSKDKKKKKTKSGHSSSDPGQDVSTQAEGEGPMKKRKKKSEKETLGDDSKTKVNDHEKVVDSKEKKKLKADRALDADDSLKVNSEAQDEKKESREERKRKRHESRKCLDESVMLPVNAALQGEAAEKKTKKRKREDKAS